MTTNYVTGLSLDECAKRIRARTYGLTGMVKPSWYSLLGRSERPGEGTVVAELKNDRFRLYAFGPRWLRNSFAPHLYGTIASVVERTRISCRFQMHGAARAFLIVWFGVLAIAVTLVLLAVISSLAPRSVLWEALLGAGGMAAFCLALVGASRYAAHGQRIRLERFLREDLEAVPDNPALSAQAEHLGGSGASKPQL
ncbi:MAG: hypothetical protein RDV41_12295 [Planctomycetota bacterium]|nr:hypothetical protein [Planctomycetota bacterium]